MSVGISTALVIGGLAAAGGSVVSSAIGAHAAGSAADKQVAASERAQAQQQPWVDAGKVSLAKLMDGINSGQFGTPQMPTEAQAQATPGYQFTKNEGLRAIGAQASAAGNSLGGAAVKEEERYATGLADSTYNDVFNRSMASQAQAYNQLAGVSGTGQIGATNVGNLMTEAGNAQAAGTVGQANAIGGGISGATNGVLQSILLGKLGGTPATPNFASPAALESAGALTVPPLPDFGTASGYGLPPG